MRGFFGRRSWLEYVNKVVVGCCDLSRVDRAFDTPEHGVGQLGAENDLNALKVGRKNDQAATGSISLSKRRRLKFPVWIDQQSTVAFVTVRNRDMSSYGPERLRTRTGTVRHHSRELNRLY